ncbi:hypothetical protein ACJX0J_024830, partial [Zea mays]
YNQEPAASLVFHHHGHGMPNFIPVLQEDYYERVFLFQILQSTIGLLDPAKHNGTSMGYAAFLDIAVGLGRGVADTILSVESIDPLLIKKDTIYQ